MSREELEARIDKLGDPWKWLMGNFQQGRDYAVKNLSDGREEIAAVHQQHYDDLLAKMLELATR